MYLIGGTITGKEYAQSQMYRLDLQTYNWDQIATFGDGDPSFCPAQLDEHTAVLEGNHAIVFGGFEDGERTNKVLSFDTELHKWKLIAPANAEAPAPKPRAGHSAVIHQGKLYIFGGKDDENQKLDDFWTFDLSSKTWEEIIPANPDARPSKRSGHSATIYDNYMILFGGIFEVTKELNDCHLYDIGSNRWITLFMEKKEPMSAQSPTKTMAMGAVSPLMRKGTKTDTSPKGDKSMGGAMKNNFAGAAPPKKIKIPEETKKPQKEVKLDSPTSTDMQRSLLIASADPSFDFMAQMKRKKNNFGFGNSTHNSFGLNMSLSQKGKLRVCGIRPNPRDGHSSVIYNGLMLIFGGDRHHMPFNDMFALDLPNEIERQSF